MNIQTIEQTYDLLSLVGKDTTLIRSGAYHVGPCPFCGGVDRFTLKRTVDGYRWYCRKCGDGKYHSVFDYLMRRDHLSFPDAVERLSGGSDYSRNDFVPQNKPAQMIYQLPPEDWQDKGRSFMALAGDRLIKSAEAEPAREFLRLRGLHEWIWYRALLGYVRAYDPVLKLERPAVCIPHLDNPLTLMAVKFRFIDEIEGGLRYTAMKGSNPLFFGMDTLRTDHETLIIVEGELNQLSIYQVIVGHIKSSPRVSVVSPGSENLTRTQKATLPVLVSHYKRVIIWTDKDQVAKEVEALLDRPCVLLKSPFGRDANDLLREGVLGEFLRQIGVRLG